MRIFACLPVVRERKGLFLSAEHVFHGVEIAVAEKVVGLEIARLGPFVPAVHRYQRMDAAPGDVALCLSERFFKGCRRVVFADGGHKAVVVEAGIVVPAHRHLREIREAERVRLRLPFPNRVGDDLGIVPVHVGKRKELIMRGAVEADFAESLVHVDIAEKTKADAMKLIDNAWGM